MSAFSQITSVASVVIANCADLFLANWPSSSTRESLILRKSERYTTYGTKHVSSDAVVCLSSGGAAPDFRFTSMCFNHL